MPETSLETRFTAAMLDIYNTALSELKYPATRFCQMVIEQGGLVAAQRLLATPSYRMDSQNSGHASVSI